MSSVDKQNSNFTTSKLLVDTLAADGVLCNSFNKNYDEQGTYDGGAGNRKRFTLENNKIIDYHQVLKILTGEWRANIHEAIPAIDFLNRENTSIMNSYLVEDGVVRSDTIVPIPALSTSVMQSLIEDDPYTINRAVTGEEVAEHFYNASGSMGQTNCLVSPPSESLANFAYVYKGIKNPSFTIYDSDGGSHKSASLRLDKAVFLAPRIGETCTISYDPDSTVATYSKKSDGWNEGRTDEFNTIILERGFLDGPSSNNSNTFVTEDDNPLASNSALAKALASVITISDEKSLAISLSNGDFSIILPGSLSSLDATKILVFKQDYVNGGYKIYIAYATSVSYSTEPISLDIGDKIPAIPSETEEGEVIDASAFNSVVNYLAVEKEYYSKASGLLCGAFSEPAEYTNLGDTRVVTTWKFLNDSDDAIKRGLTIPVGTKLYPNYLLGRGTIKDSPLATSEKDSEGNTYPGFATWIYNTIDNKIQDIYGKYGTDTATWAALPDARLGAVITKDAWMGKTSSEVTNPLKFKTSAGSSIGFDEIESYISKASRSLRLGTYTDALGIEYEGYSITLDNSDPFAEYKHRTVQNTGFLGLGRQTGTWSGNGAASNTLGTDYRHMFRLEWTCRRKRNGKVINSSRDLSVKVMSPYQAYKPSNVSDGSPYLIWPSEKSLFPAKAYLLSRTSLGVGPGYEGSNTICFYNNIDNKSLAFEVSSVTEFPASKIVKVDWYNDEINSRDSKFITVDNASDHDCYIYTLENLNVDLEDLTFTDKAGNVVAEMPNLRASVVPFSYPRSYFNSAISRKTDGTFRYLLSTAVANDSFKSLPGSIIIPGLLDVNMLSSGSADGVPSHKLPAYEGIRKLFSAGSAYDTAKSSLIKDCLYNLLYNRPVSEKTDISDTGEVITLGEVPEIIDGLATLPPYLNNLISSGFSVNGKELADEDFIRFYKRLETASEAKVIPDYILSYTSATPSAEITVIENGKTVKKTIKEYVESALNAIDPTSYYTPSESSQAGSFDIKKLNKVFEDVVKAAASSLIKIKLASTYTQEKARPSLAIVASRLRQIFSTSSNSNITEEDCRIIDDIFGNNTKAFLLTRDEEKDEAVPETSITLSENLISAYGEVIDAVDVIFKDTVKEAEITSITKTEAPEAFANFNTKVAELKEEIRSIYLTYFTDESIHISGTVSPSVDATRLVVNPAKIRSVFNALKESPERFVRTQYGWSWNYSYASGGGFFTKMSRAATNAAFYLAFRTVFGNSAWNTCDTVMREWKNMSIDSFISTYALTTISPPASLSSTNKRIHAYLIDTASNDCKAAANRAASTSTAAAISSLISQSAELEAAKAKALEYTQARYKDLSGDIATVNSLLDLSWTNIISTLSEASSRSNYIGSWLDDAGIAMDTPTHYRKEGSAFIEDEAGRYINKSSISPEYASSFSYLLDGNYLRGDQQTVKLPLPQYAMSKGEFENSGNTLDIVLPPYALDELDIDNNILVGIADFVKTALEGTSKNGNENYFVKFEPGDEEVTGRPNSLYYERYLYLNSRLNKASGSLYKAAIFAQARKHQDVNDKIEDQLETLNRKYFTVVPVEWATELAYFKPQMLEKMNTYFPGKFYYKAQLEEMAQQINGRCMLTCGYCPVKSECPFYGEDEVLKMSCMSAPSIDLYVKDNVPDLLYYDEGMTKEDDNGESIVVGRSPELYYEEEDIGSREELDHNLIKKMSKPYASVAKKLASSKVTTGLIYEEDNSSQYRDLTTLEEDVRNALGGLDFDKELSSGLGWLTGGRWGTLQKNKLAEPNSGLTNEEYPAENFPKNKYFYDAVFMNDEETEVLYTASQNWYDVSVTTAANNDSDGTPKTYKGKTRIKIPAALKAFAERPNGDVYLVSDDLKDDQGNDITPIIYLGNVKDIEYAFDLREEGSCQDEVTTSTDNRLYPKDVAQWSINVAKGNCLWDKIDPDAFIKQDLQHDAINGGYDQYWMPTLKKRVTVNGEERILELDGRPRKDSGYSEVVLDPDNMNEYEVISGRPVAASRIDFLRKVSFRILDGTASSTNDGYGLIPWCKAPGDPSKPDDEHLYVDVQKSVLPFMKTNLRLVICETGE